MKLWEHSWFGAFKDILPLLIRPSDVLPIDLGFVRTKMRQWNEENMYVVQPRAVHYSFYLGGRISAKRPSKELDIGCEHAHNIPSSSTLGVLSKMPSEVILMIAAELPSL